MINNEEHLLKVLHVLDNENILPHIIIIGSWATLFYANLFNDYSPTIRTVDIDFYVPNTKIVVQKNNVINSFREIKYFLRSDSFTSKSTFASTEGFEIEFLTKLNKENLACVKLGNTNIYAESISYLDIFNSNYIEVDYKGLKVNVISPASYVLQKLLINGVRKNKKEQDILSVRYVLRFIVNSPDVYDDLINLYNSLPKKWKTKIAKTMEENNISF